MNEIADKKLQELHKKLFNYVEEQNKNWKSFVYAKENGFYQGFDEIGINGCRSTEKRFERYNITKYLSKNKLALDIGCNCGFFSIFASRCLKQITGIEINPYLIKIANETKRFMNITNSVFNDTSFEDFESKEKYDIIFSLANDETIDGNTKFTFKEYIQKIYGLLTEHGFLIFETVAPDTFEPRLFKPKFEVLKQKFTILEDRMVETEYPINVPERRFLILQK
jgi:SAM-dependent methyltransferase